MKTTAGAGDLRKYAWDYFAVHAAQRMAAFQFFITLSTAVIAGFLLLVRNTGGAKWMSILGVLLTFLAFVFYKLERRTRQLVKNGEEALKFLDASLHLPPIAEGQPNPLALFERDDAVTSSAKSKWPFVGHFSYSRCFNYVFLGFGLLGLLGALSAFIYFPVTAEKEKKDLTPTCTTVFEMSNGVKEVIGGIRDGSN